jgi:diaminopimelate decarboxylase
MVLGLGVSPSRIIYAQPCKTKSYLRHARKVGVTLMTFDNTDELRKIKDCYPEAELVLRILTDDSASLCRLSAKYGASLPDAKGLLALAKELELNIVGVSFHVGSGASDPNSFGKAVMDARSVFDQASELGYDLKLLDVGGGFVDETFEMFAGNLHEALEEHFPSHVRVIGEPGRYYTSNAFTLATNVIARREVAGDNAGQNAYMLYLNDGVYGNFSNIIFTRSLRSFLLLRLTTNWLNTLFGGPPVMASTLSLTGSSYQESSTSGTGCSSRTWVPIPNARLPSSMGIMTIIKSSTFPVSLGPPHCLDTEGEGTRLE